MSESHFLLPFREKQRVRKKISPIALSIVLVSSLILMLIPDSIAENLIGVSLIYAINFCLFIIVGGRFLKTLKLIFPAMIIIFFLGLPTFFNQTGGITTSLTIGSLIINLNSVNMIKAVFIWLRGFFSVSLITLYSTCMTLQEFIQNLRSLFIPQLIVTIILLILRYAPMLYGYGQEIRTAQRMRGLDLVNRKRKFVAASAMMGGTIIKSLKQGNEVYEAMILRGLENTNIKFSLCV